MEDSRSIDDIRNALMAELLSGETDQACPIDNYFDHEKKSGKGKGSGTQFSDEALAFIAENRNALQKIHESAQIPFFKRWDYEKLLNNYTLTGFSSSPKKAAAPDNQLKASKNEKSSEDPWIKEVADLIANIESLKWTTEKTKRWFLYTAEFNGYPVNYIIGRGGRKGSFYYKGQLIEAELYDRDVVNDRIRTVAPKPTIRTVIVSENGQSITIENGNEVADSDSYLTDHKKKELKHVSDEHGRQKQGKESRAETSAKVKKQEYQKQLDEFHKNLAIVKARQKKKSLEQQNNARQQAQESRIEKMEQQKRLQEEREQHQKRLDNMRRIETQKRQSQQEEKSLPKIGYTDFMVRRSVFKCTHDKHLLDDVSAVVTIITNDGKEEQVKVSAGYCKTCKIYFIMESTYESLKRKGVILCRVCDEKSYLKNLNASGMQLANESILMQYGYNVNQAEGLTETQRQKILAALIDKRIMTKAEIISYLDFFINQRKYRDMYYVAISKWETDRTFVENYRLGDYSKFGVKAIYRN